MPRITPIHWKKLECVFFKAGFSFKRQSSSHRAYTKPGITRPIIIPVKTEIDIDIISKDLRTAGISRDEYFRLLNEC